MQDLPHTRATYEDLLAVPPHLIAEIIGGQLVTHPRPAPRHLLCTSRLGPIIACSYDWQIGFQSDGWWVLDRPEQHLDEEILVPDIAGWRTERMPELPDTAWFSMVPDWVCEVIYPATARYIRCEKRDIYAANGVEHLWHIDPSNRLLEVFELSSSNWVLIKTWRDDERVAAPPFPNAPFNLGRLWAD